MTPASSPPASLQTRLEGSPPVHDWHALERRCRELLPGRAVVSARQELLSYDCDGLTLHRYQQPLVVLPETTEQVAAVVRLCHQQGVPFVARGSGTGLSGFNGQLYARRNHRTDGGAQCKLPGGLYD